MTTQSSWRISRLASRAPTTAGMSMLRATIAVCEVLPPTSVTKPANTLRLNCSMSAGEMSLATSTSGSSPALSSRRDRAASRRRGAAAPRGEARPQQALDDLLEVGLALAQVLVLHLVELARQHLELGRQRPFGVVVALADPVLGARRSAPRPAAASGARRAAPTARRRLGRADRAAAPSSSSATALRAARKRVDLGLDAASASMK